MERIRTAVWVVGLAAVLWWLHPASDEPFDDGRTEVTIWFNGPVEGRHLDAVDAFERRFPEFRGILGSSAARTGLDAEGNPQRLMCGIAGGVPPEVVEYDRFAVAQWAARDAFLDLNPLIERDLRELEELKRELDAISAGDAPTDDTAALRQRMKRLERYLITPDDYYPQTWDECTYGGGQYGIPNYMDDRVLYYNADMLVRHGFVDEEGQPVPPDTWEQVLRKRVDVTDAELSGLDRRRARVISRSASFVAAGVRPGDTLAHISGTGVVTRCLVDEVVSPDELIVRSAYAGRDLALPSRGNQHVKIFDQDGYALRLSRWDDQGRMQVVGFEPSHGNGWLYMYGWMNGGEFLSEDGRTCTLDDPRIAGALEWTTDVYDALGGVENVNAFKRSFQSDAQDPFLQYQIGMFINGDWYLRDLARYGRDLRFGTHPPPVPARRLEEPDGRYFTWVAGFAYCIPATCPPEKIEAAWWLVKFLSSVEGGMLMNEHDAQRERGQGRPYMPRLMANRQLNQAQMDAYVNVPEIPAHIRRGIQTHIDLLPHGRFRPVSPEGRLLWDAQATAQDIAWNHRMTPADALASQTRRVQQALDRFHAPPRGQTTRWAPWVWGYLAAIAALTAFVFLRHRARHRVPAYMRRDWRAGALFMLPWFVGFVVFSGGPMLFSGLMSFTDYDVLSPPVWVGLDNYAEMLDPRRDPLFFKSLGNTLYMTIGVPLGMAVGLGLAMLLNAKVRGMSIYRTLFFLPAIMPVVAASILWIWVFNPQNGLMNNLLRITGIEMLIDWLHVQFDTGIRTPITWLTSERTSKPALIIMGLWGAGASMIIWLAGLKAIPAHLYEAAELDGAGPVRRFLNITLPMLSPYILFNLIIGLIGTLQIFTQAYIMTPGGSPGHSTYFYVYKLFDECFSYFRLGYGAAMAWILFLIIIVLTLINLTLSKRWVYYAGE